MVGAPIMKRWLSTLGFCIAAALHSLPANAQQRFPLVGFLDSRASNQAAAVVAAFLKGLGETGFRDGQNVALEYRFADGQYSQLPAMASDLATRKAAVMLAGGPPAVLAAKSAVPVVQTVFISSLDPVKLGLANSLNRPGRSMTGVYLFTSELEPKKLDLLHQLAPKAETIGILVNAANPNADTVLNDLKRAADALHVRLVIGKATNPQEIDNATASIVEQGAGGLLVVTDPFLTGRHAQLIGIAARHSLPTMYALRESAVAGGLISYGTSITEAYRQAGNYAGRILKGEKAADLPIVQPSKFDLTVNLQTARTLGLTVPRAMQMLAEDLIE
jgi:putative ABC transport system substrate-binding protein